MQFFRFLLYQLIADFDNMLHSDYNFSTVLYSQCILTSTAISRCQQYVKRLNEKSSKNPEIANERVRFERRRERERGGCSTTNSWYYLLFSNVETSWQHITHMHISSRAVFMRQNIHFHRSRIYVKSILLSEPNMKHCIKNDENVVSFTIAPIQEMCDNNMSKLKSEDRSHRIIVDVRSFVHPFNSVN